MTYLLLSIAMLCGAIALILQENKINKLQRKFDIIAEKHNWLIDTTVDMYEDLVDQFNERIDEVNYEFNNVHEVLWASKEFADELTDTMELMCDTDEIIIDRLNDIEDVSDEMEEEISFANVAIDDLDSILYEIFENTPEEVEEENKKKAWRPKKK